MIDSFSEKHRFLSNFYKSEVKFDGDTFPTVEHAFQAAKTLSKDARSCIQHADTPGRAKRLGRKVDLRKDWESIKIAVMRDLLQQKFEKGSELSKLLIATEEQELVEGNTWKDTFWGVCDGRGANHLGRLLMEIREDLK